MIDTLNKHELKLDEILIHEEKPLDSAKLEHLIESIQEKGLVSPVTLNSDHHLIAGFHRFMAFKKLAEKDPQTYGQIPVRILNEADCQQLQQLETTEKLFRTDLSILEKAEAFKAYFDSLKYGQERHKTTVIFKTLDISRRTFFNLRAIAERLSQEVRERIKTLTQQELSNSTPQLLALAKYEESIQLRLLERLEQGLAATVFDAIRQDEQDQLDESTGRKGRRKFLKSPSLKLNKDLRKELLELSRKTGKGQNELFNEIFETGLELIQRQYL
ncbi:hypothetical protein COW36_03820 [bacterium (Candidatus Blackallbacteria) CG17_big_fil_post_rev_8_21_14_2_50_48_46]|uniref:ParB-like N-terminal domain-containing protein n=1 Tax=bacterium (Candidatus Blackallbacteria) CG17_big_fil_post_rev_8_21_14_2_50_48_46 TaxID=2014261 RepID=A0A2M7G8J4_9BACT|nr:MAG: hypothetical protein COW64_05125 [bacterium (Candidatus Blackallbacteria) CG18_big_fil_WC_8_21_14_2_50_49_26]PIW18428.1 MAG: hypothetical protein COW36_03820 [bacterium (Candidatus Blackallbacteria) CG17_big_fil_post_rev_8_21_14_2_50_48_46]PIW46587.1 MAG: hypothetical protein COW20_16860 [bacterium (Candidatus Blackallbacteria) CG13_big_fil_rev_8_21_14_2_50_49_14]